VAVQLLIYDWYAGRDGPVRLAMTGRRAGSLSALALALLGVGCEGPQSALDVAGRDAERISALFWIMTVGATAIWALVVLVSTHAIRHRREQHSHRTANLLIIGGGVALPAVVLAALLAYGMPVLGDVLTPAPAGALQIDVTAKQWWWRVQYAVDGRVIETANELRLPVGQRVNLRLLSLDVIHSFWVPSIAGKMDMFPGRVTHLALEPTRTGTFLGACAEYCGASHALMGFTVVVMDAGDFARWLDEQYGGARPAQDTLARQGAAEFLANGCGACHAVRGSAADGRIGPDLTHVASRLRVGAGQLQPAASDFARWIAEPDAIKPGVHMPAFRALPPDRVMMLVAYLSSLK
jgi:cytochrome c oxidase subunit II